MAENAKVLLEISFETVVQKFSSPAARRVSFPDFTSKGVHILGFRVECAPRAGPGLGSSAGTFWLGRDGGADEELQRARGGQSDGLPSSR